MAIALGVCEVDNEGWVYAVSGLGISMVIVWLIVKMRTYTSKAVLAIMIIMQPLLMQCPGFPHILGIGAYVVAATAGPLNTSGLASVASMAELRIKRESVHVHF